MNSRERTIETTLAIYKRFVSPVLHALPGLGGACRFQPTCSEYAVIALREHGFLRGGAMAIGRILRCHPFHKGGFDPVPAKSGSFTRCCSAAITIEEPHSYTRPIGK